VVGRFLSVDPHLGNPATLEEAKLEELLGNPQKHDLYAYVLNNPLRYSDPDGLEESSRNPTVRINREEIAAFRRAGYGRMESTVSRESGNISVLKRGETHVTNLEMVPGKRVSELVPRSGWRRVTAEFHVKGPDGAPVAGRFYTVIISHPAGSQGARGLEKGEAAGYSVYNVRTDENGVLKFQANVPRSGGKLQIMGTYDEGGEVKVASNAGQFDFKRASEQTKLGFDVNLKSNEPASAGPESEGATAEIKQTK
jgi:hypothetical protein